MSPDLVGGVVPRRLGARAAGWSKSPRPASEVSLTCGFLPQRKPPICGHAQAHYGVGRSRDVTPGFAEITRRAIADLRLGDVRRPIAGRAGAAGRIVRGPREQGGRLITFPSRSSWPRRGPTAPFRRPRPSADRAHRLAGHGAGEQAMDLAKRHASPFPHASIEQPSSDVHGRR
jgi:hypothetical protein